MDAKAQADLEEARKAGIDLNLIDCNLALTPEQRIERHQGALELALQLRRAGEKHHAAVSPSVSETQ